MLARSRITLTVAVAISVAAASVEGAAAQGSVAPSDTATPPQAEADADADAESDGASTGDAQIDPAQRQDAMEHFQQGLRFAEERDFHAALVEFRRANDLVPNYRILYNIAVASRELRDYATAYRSFVQYLAEGGDRIDAERQETVRAEIASAEPRIGRVEVWVVPDGAEVRIDDQVVGTAPLSEPVVVNLGSRVVSASAPGRDTATRRLEIAARDHVSISLELPETPPPTIAVAASAVPAIGPTPAHGQEWGAAFWVSTGTTAALVIAAAITGGLSLQATADYRAALSRFPLTPEEVAGMRSTVRDLSIAADILGGTAAAAAILSFVLFFTDTSDTGDAADVSASISPLGASLSARF
jgi:hypothetical protein